MQPLDHNQQVPQGGWGSVGREQRAASPGRAQRLQPLCVAAVNTRVFRGSQSLQAPKPHLPHPGRGGLSCAKAVPGLCYPPCTSAISSALQGDKDFFILFYFGDENCQTDSSVTRTVSFLPSLWSRIKPLSLPPALSCCSPPEAALCSCQLPPAQAQSIQGELQLKNSLY